MFFKKKIIGIDIGNSSIKIVELSKWGGKVKLENYGELSSEKLSKESLLSVDEKGNLVSSNLISSAIKDILKEAHINTKKVVFSIPDFLTFATAFNIPPMPEKEIAGAVYYNASRYITLPSSEVTLDWKIVPNDSREKSSQIKVFVVAIANQVIDEYKKIAKSAGLELLAIEPEIFGVARSLIGSNKDAICLLDIGAKTSTINIIDNGYLKRSYSSNFGGNQISAAISGVLKSNDLLTEKIKTEEGILSQKSDVVKAQKDLIDQFFSEIKNIQKEFFDQEKKQVKEFYLSGGVSNMPGLKDYFSSSFKSSFYMPNYFLEFSRPKILENLLVKMSPRFSVAVGVALGILES
ncbi:MAG: type IV pilus assembly protein PilM [Candidatus Staskawiczbacteria bacterium]|nr:type IV pilus assembly protein PilM [Candidatus Staskawiczbacteria bacterium]